MINRIIIIVLDSLGVGALPDACEYGDENTNTLSHIAEFSDGLYIPNLQNMGIGNITNIKGVAPNNNAIACYGKMSEKSKGKDTITGHWELMGIISEKAFPTYPNGFPDEIIIPFEKAIGRKIIGNKSASGTEIIAELGTEHIKSGSPIVYTSADSVFQIAGHIDIIPLNELYNICQIARNMLVGEHNIQRVIARPFIGKAGSFVRTADRKDFSVSPPSKTLLDYITDNNGSVFAIGKIEDIFNGMGITEAVHTTSNKHGMQLTIDAAKSSNYLLIFTNLVDFDTVYGHRNDIAGYANSLEEFDRMLPELMDSMKSDDMLVITADHGCDPSTPGTDHTREYVPLLIYGKNINKNINLGIRSSFADLAKTLAEILNIKNNLTGESFAQYIKSWI